MHTQVILRGQPLSTNHVYKSTAKSGKLIRYMTPDGKALKESYQLQAMSQHSGLPLEGALSVEVDLFFGDKCVRDIDNYHKLSLDALTGTVWHDDKQIMELRTRKGYDKKDPRIVISIKTMEE